MSNSKKKPLSPHLSIYKPQISSVLSISHRMSGVFNFIGMLTLLWWIVYIAFSTEDITRNCFWKFFSSKYGMGVLLIWSFSLFFHMCTGIRHLFWDCGLGFSIKAMNFSGWFAIISAFTLTTVTWVIIFQIIKV